MPNIEIKDGYAHYECGCKFKALSTNNDLKLEFNPDLESIPLDCQRTWDLISEGNTKGVFQLETRFGQQYAKKMMPNNIEHLAALGAILRPGCLNSKDENGKSVTDLYIERKNGLSEVQYFHPALEDILKSTYGLLVYQEQAMQIAQKIAGFNLEQADALRKCVTGDTKFISKTRGFIDIDTLLKDGYKDDLFLVMDENGVQQWKKIVNIWSTGLHDVRNVKTSSGMSVKSTKYHQFLTNNGWKARMRLCDSDYIVCAREIEYDGKDDISESLAMVIAGIITEGYFVEDAGTFVNYDKRMMDIFSLHFENVFKRKKTNNQETVFSIHKEERQFLNKYIEYGLSESKKIPQVMMGMTKNTTSKFLSFMFGAECGITKNSGSVEYSSKSEEMIKQVQLLLLRYGIRSYYLETKVKEYPDNTYYRLYINDQVDQQKLYDKLTYYWPSYKKDDLRFILENKNTENYTTDIIPTNITNKLLNQYPYVGRKESGTLYTSNISRNRFKRIADMCGDKYWQQIANGKQQYLKVKNLDEKHKQKITYDFTIEGEDTPYIIANGLVIHNCIGKKKADLMAEVKKEFIRGCKETQIVTEEEADTIFGWIEKSQRYSFNKSHAISYAINGYLSAYAKAHFPVSFFTSYLYYSKDKQNKFDEIKLLVNNAKSMGIDVKPPDFRYTNSHFKRISYHSNNEVYHSKDNRIYFGFADIKGIGESVITKIHSSIYSAEVAIEKPKDKWSWSDFLIFFSQEVPSTAISGIIEAGALDYFNVSRTQMLFEYNEFSKLTAKEQAWIKQKKDIFTNCSLKDVIEYCIKFEPGKGRDSPCANKNRYQKFKEIYETLCHLPFSIIDSPDWIARIEEARLGISLTSSILDSCKNLDQANCTILQFQKQENMNSGIFIAGQVNEIKTHITKNGDEMAFMSISDNDSELDCVIFPETWNNINKSICAEENTVMVSGDRSRTNKDSLIVKNMWQLT